jgi:hypothetical protein
MNYGDILDEWENTQSKENTNNSNQSRLKEQKINSREKPQQFSVKDQMISWLNQYGVEDKDGRGG